MSKDFYSLSKYKFDSIELVSSFGCVYIKTTDDFLYIAQDANSIYKAKDNVENHIKMKTFPTRRLSLDTSKIVRIKANLGNRSSVSSEKKRIDELSNRLDFESNSIYFPTYRRIETDFIGTLTYLNNVHHREDLLYRMSRISREHEEQSYSNLNNKVRVLVGYTNRDIELLLKNKWDEITRKEKNLLNKLSEDFIESLLEPIPQDLLSNSYNEFDNQENFKKELNEVFGKTRAPGSREKISTKINKYIDELNLATERLQNLDSSKKDVPDKRGLYEAFVLIESKKQLNKLIALFKSTSERIEELKLPLENVKLALESFLRKKVLISDGQLLFCSEDTELEFEALSAGEKQIVSMLIYLYLDIDYNTVVLIDEPELSLHVAWQRLFINALAKINTRVQYIIATHSPFIIGNHADKIIEMGSYEEDLY